MTTGPDSPEAFDHPLVDPPVDPVAEAVEEDVEIDDRLDNLTISNRILSDNVQGLTDALIVVNRLAAEQTLLKKRGLETDLRVTSVELDSHERIDRVRKFSLAGAGVLILLIPIISTLVYLSLINHVNFLLDQQNRGAYSACQTRNSAAINNADREGQLAQVESDVKVARIHLNSEAALRRTLINCNLYLERLHKK